MPKAKPSYIAYRANPANRIKLRAREICSWAIQCGKLTRSPCEKCGEPKSEAHHDDYSKPFDVRWLCRKCHMGVHFPSPVGRRRHNIVGWCAKGHQLTPNNTFMRGACPRCKTCEDERTRKSTPSISELSQRPLLCRAGHPQTLDNSYSHPRGNSILCRECKRDTRRKYNAKIKAKPRTAAGSLD